MRRLLRYFLVCLGLYAGASALSAQETQRQASAILGTWEGTSICVDLKLAPACKDEVVIYEFTAGAGGLVHLAADKVVNGERGRMYDADFSYDPVKRRWSYEFNNGRYHGLWWYQLDGDKAHGQLDDVASGKQVRKVEVRKKGNA